MSLSVRERAERITNFWIDMEPDMKEFCSFVAAEIEEAVREAKGPRKCNTCEKVPLFLRCEECTWDVVRNNMEVYRKSIELYWENLVKKARAEALEQAAKNLEAEASRLHSKAREVKDHLDTWMDHHSNAFREAAARIRALAKREGK